MRRPITAILAAATVLLASAAAHAGCKLTKAFRVVQKDGFTVQFQKSGGSWSAFTDKYGSAPVELSSLTKNGFTMLVFWAHGEPAIYKIGFITRSNFGGGNVTTPDRSVAPVQLRSIDPVRTCN